MVTTWNVLELLDREPATTLTLDEARDGIVHLLTRDRYLTLRREAAARWHEQLAQRVHDAVDPHAWAAVRFSLNR